jgi:hypothetical protein
LRWPGPAPAAVAKDDRFRSGTPRRLAGSDALASPRMRSLRRSPAGTGATRCRQGSLVRRLPTVRSVRRPMVLRQRAAGSGRPDGRPRCALALDLRDADPGFARQAENATRGTRMSVPTREQIRLRWRSRALLSSRARAGESTLEAPRFEAFVRRTGSRSGQPSRNFRLCK